MACLERLLDFGRSDGALISLLLILDRLQPLLL